MQDRSIDNLCVRRVVELDVAAIQWDKVQGLLPVIVQDAASLRVLMLGYMNEEALRITLESGLVTFYSRTRQKIWQKGETSGHFFHVRSLRLDCDQDSLLVLVEPQGVACHRGSVTCFDEDLGEEKFAVFPAASLATLADVAAVIKDRYENPCESSYTSSLFRDGLSRMAQKVGEEGVEVALAGATEAPNLVSESADLLFHLLVLLQARGVSLGDVLGELHQRRLKPAPIPK